MDRRQLDSFILQNMVHFDEEDCRQPAITRAVYETYPNLAETDVAASLSRLESAGLMSRHPSVFCGQDEVSWRVSDFPRATAILTRWRSEGPRRRLSVLAAR